MPDAPPDGLILAESCCDACGAAAHTWPAGLISIDREVGVFTADFLCCPTCAVTANFAPATGLLGMIRDGVEFADITWYWYEGGANV